MSNPLASPFSHKYQPVLVSESTVICPTETGREFSQTDVSLTELRTCARSCRSEDLRGLQVTNVAMGFGEQVHL